ncbi:hypothetical protein ACGFMK_48065, partial [Amycolatopsis sp. NPDC049252]|uniref:hypothetical protein n=1 Tax=Amycolatopsis sp. NPDC049252 TaxID=3363933 RepID=UPI003721BD4F
MALDDVAKQINDKDDSRRVHASLHDMYLRDGAEKPSHADFDEKFRLQLKERDVENSAIDELAKLVAAQLALKEGEFFGNPEEFAKEFIKRENWAPPAAATPAEAATPVPAVAFTEVDGFLKDAHGQMFLKDEKTKVFEHKTHPVKGIYYDEQQGLYQHGEPYPKFTEVDGFLKDKSGRLFLKDEKTQVFEHKTHPVKGIYYDEQHGLY